MNSSYKEPIHSEAVRVLCNVASLRVSHKLQNDPSLSGEASDLAYSAIMELYEERVF